MPDSSRKNVLIDKALNGQCSKDELKELYTLLSPDELHSMLERGWDSLPASIKLDDLSSHSIRKNLEKKIQNSAHKVYVLRIAAAIALLAGIYYVLQFYGAAPQTIPSDTVAFVAEAGTRNKVTLDDGSVVWLNSGSSIEVPEKFGKERRTVRLVGEAFFDVAKEKDRPFIVQTGKLNTTVMGTSFNIKAYTNETNIQVTVATGKVRVASAANEVTLLPDMQTNFNVSTGEFEVRDIVTEYFTDWRDGMLRLDGSLSEIAPILERVYGKAVIFENPALRSCRITGNYKDESIDNVLNSFRYILETDYMIKGDTVILKGKGCSK